MKEEKELNSASLAIHLIDEPRVAMRSQIDMVGIKELADDIRQIGLIHPINVMRVGDRFEVIAGHRRLLALRMLGWQFAPCIIRELDELDVTAMMAAENLTREGTNPLDEALMLGRVIGEDESKVPELAKRMNRSEAWIRGRLAILGYDELMLSAIRDGAIPLAVAALISEVTDDGWRTMFTKDAIAHGWTALQAQFQVNLFKSGALDAADAPPPPPPSGDLKDAPKGDVMCARCGRPAIAPNFRSVFIHHECPPDQAVSAHGSHD